VRVAAEASVSVLVPVAVAAPYTYRAPADVKAGDIVAVPLGTREVVGVVWDDPADPTVGHNRLRPIEGRFEAPPLPAEIRRFVDWVADYTLTSRGMVLRMVLRSAAALEPEQPVPGVRLAGELPERMTAARQRVLEFLRENGGMETAWTKSGLAAAAGVSPGVVQGLVDAGTLAAVLMPPAPAAPPPDPDYARPELNATQQAAADGLRAAVAKGDYSVTLLDGVTGSGKTQV
jgi:primosomal protein N' (replication factor Y)